MIQSIESLPAELQSPPLGDLDGLGEGYVKIVDAARRERVAAHCGAIGKSGPLNPVNLGRADAETGIRVSISDRAELGAGRRRQHRARVERSARMADVGTGFAADSAACDAIADLERCAGLKCCDARQRPTAQCPLPQALSRTGNIPYIKNREALGPIVIAGSMIEL